MFPSHDRGAEYWNKNGQGWGQQVHGTYTAEVVDGFYQFRADNPDIPNWWFPRDFMDGQQLTQRTFIGWGTTQKDIDDLKEAFEKGIFDKEKDKKLLKVVNDLDGSDQLIKATDTPTNVVDDGIELYHSRAKGIDLPESDKGLHAGTYNAALDKAAMQYNNINFYNWAFDAQEKIAIAHNNLVDIVADDIQLELEDLKEGNSIPFDREEAARS